METSFFTITFGCHFKHKAFHNALPFHILVPCMSSFTIRRNQNSKTCMHTDREGVNEALDAANITYLPFWLH